MTSSRDTARVLLEIASRQGGYFTAQQAHSVGYAYPEQSYHVSQGNWARVARGIYRLRGYPSSDRDDLIILYSSAVIAPGSHRPWSRMSRPSRSMN